MQRAMQFLSDHPALAVAVYVLMIALTVLAWAVAAPTPPDSGDDDEG